MQVLICHDDNFDYRIRLPEGTTVDMEKNEITIPVGPNEIVGDRFTMSHFMITEAARDCLFPGLVMIGKVSRWENLLDAELMEGLVPLIFDGVEEEADRMSAKEREQDAPRPTG